MTGSEPVPQVLVRAPSARGSILRWGIIILVLGAAVHFTIGSLPAIRESLGVLEAMAPGLVLAAVLAQMASYISTGYELRSAIALFGEKVSIWRTIAVYVAGYSIAVVGGGQIGYIAAVQHWLVRARVSTEAALVASFLPAAINVPFCALIAVVGMGYLIFARHVSALFLATFLAAFVLIAAGALIALLMLARNRLALAIIDFLAARWAQLRRAPASDHAGADLARRLGDLQRVLKRGGWRGPVLADALSIAFDMCTLELMLAATNHPATPTVLLAGYGVPLLVGRLSFLPGGLGAVEAGMVALYSTLGIPTASAAIAVLGYRLIAFWAPLLIGFVVVPILNRRPRATQKSTLNP